MQLSHSTLCPACEVGTLHEQIGSQEYSYKGRTFSIEGNLFSRCDACGAEIVMPWQAKANDQLVRDFHREIDGLLRGSEIKHIRKKFSLTQTEAAQLFGGGANAFSKYERGEVIQSVAMDRLLRLVSSLPWAFETLAKITHLPSNLVLKTKEFEGEAECDYGTCGSNMNGASDFFPRNVVSVDFRLKKRQKLTSTSSSNIYDQASG
jgi:putative zinc finger/helix-turn-helix YgiT family protein